VFSNLICCVNLAVEPFGATVFPDGGSIVTLIYFGTAARKVKPFIGVGVEFIADIVTAVMLLSVFLKSKVMVRPFFWNTVRVGYAPVTRGAPDKGGAVEMGDSFIISSKEPIELGAVTSTGDGTIGVEGMRGPLPKIS